MKAKKGYDKKKQQRRQGETAIYLNRAVLEEGPTPAHDVTGCSCCLEELVFAMQDSQHQFSIGLSTILSCLAIAEQGGYVPRLPPDWRCSLLQL